MGRRAAWRAAALHRAGCHYRPKWEDRCPIRLPRLAACIVADTTNNSPRPFPDRRAAHRVTNSAGARHCPKYWSGHFGRTSAPHSQAKSARRPPSRPPPPQMAAGDTTVGNGAMRPISAEGRPPSGAALAAGQPAAPHAGTPTPTTSPTAPPRRRPVWRASWRSGDSREVGRRGSHGATVTDHQIHL
jgi:hypothetical protein